MAGKWESKRAQQKLRRILTGVNSGIRPAMLDATNKLQKDVIMGLPRNTGNLEDLVTTYVSPSGLIGEVGLRGKRAKSAGFYLRFLEFGTKGHKVKVSKHKKVLSNGDDTFGTNADIPALPARPVLQPAWNRNKSGIIARVKKVIDDSILKAQQL